MYFVLLEARGQHPKGSLLSTAEMQVLQQSYVCVRAECFPSPNNALDYVFSKGYTEFKLVVA